MNFKLSIPFQKQLVNMVRQYPLLADEIRRIEGCVDYIALSSTMVDPEVYVRLWTMTIDGIGYTVYYKLRSRRSAGV